MKVFITGSQGFIGRNLRVHLERMKTLEFVLFSRDCAVESLATLLDGVEFIFHCAGANRPTDPAEFEVDNIELTRLLCDAVKNTGRAIPILFTSSTQVGNDTVYAGSKEESENVLIRFSEAFGNPVHLFRLPNVFGKWCKPNYNSVVATFCHNIARGIPIQVNDPDARLSVVYIDDVVRAFIAVMDSGGTSKYLEVSPKYETTVGELAAKIESYKHSRSTLTIDRVGVGLERALYATYLSYLEPQDFKYSLKQNTDPRGSFVEMLKTHDSGQFSYFTAHPGVTRGGHYHHTKTEKFLVIRGTACFRFRHLISGEFYELLTDGYTPEVVETVPGWTHDITNVGSDEMIVMLWANEIFDRENPDTYTQPVGVNRLANSSRNRDE